MTQDRQFLFIGGLHRSGTSLLHRILRSHPAISGFTKTGAPEDEGQHLQSVYPTAMAVGGPGRFGFDEASFMDENHPLATPGAAEKLMYQWSPHWDMNKAWLIEKSPPNLVRTRYLQKVFPNSHFLILLRHPIAVACATMKWSQTGVLSLLEHSMLCYEQFLKDMPYLDRVHVLHYEDFVMEPRKQIDAVLSWAGIEPPILDFEDTIDRSMNDRYFESWKVAQGDRCAGLPADQMFEERANELGYSINAPQERFSVNWQKRRKLHHTRDHTERFR